MDVSALPNNNNPLKLLQLDAGTLPNEDQPQTDGSAPPSDDHPVWFVDRYLDRPVMFVDRYLEKHITPITLKSNIKRNPLFSESTSQNTQNHKATPSWTVQDFDSHGTLAHYLKELKTPTDLDFWLEDLYTPGFDSLLKKKESEERRKHVCRMVSVVLVTVSLLLVVVTVSVVVSRDKN
ncbi:major intrinsically disordered NOTCH2-binding receptor 1-like homolog [Gouania willdenowi]|uniref:major intrinsically disordered NOTCH2-binding receptor 1-like homolog n=1 Tax=Gouania willdenowi TaxID=441366 RepID=UPI001055EBF0|nr:major intrinsically disordered NOTCH2-binding receptor 1-like [Gouania willdenowi]